MKVALVGNMNNNHFSLMRYFHDLGIEAHLFKFANEFDHFQPECDTYFIDKWEPYIHQTEIINGDFRQYLNLSRKELYNTFMGFDFYIGNGMTPAYLFKAGIKLDLFLPYGLGIEYTYRPYKNNLFDYVKEFVVKKIQEYSIRRNVSIICTSEEETIKKAIKLNKRVEKLSIPMVYTEISDESILSIQNILKEISNIDFLVFSHVSHVKHDSIIYKMKRNDILIQSFAKYIKRNPTHNSKLILLSYGDDLNYSKKLIRELFIEDNVIWLPLMKRKEIIAIIKKIDIGASEFGGYTWGGTGWEFLANGKPFLHYVNMDNRKLSEILGMEVPFFFNSNDPNVISKTIEYYYSNKQELLNIEVKNKDWFNRNVGISLASKYVNLLKELDAHS